MTQLMKEHTREKQNRKKTNGQLHIASEQDEHGLNLTMQKPLEKYQRQEHQGKPDKAREDHVLIININSGWRKIIIIGTTQLKSFAANFTNFR